MLFMKRIPQQAIHAKRLIPGAFPSDGAVFAVPDLKEQPNGAGLGFQHADPQQSKSAFGFLPERTQFELRQITHSGHFGHMLEGLTFEYAG